MHPPTDLLWHWPRATPNHTVGTDWRQALFLPQKTQKRTKMCQTPGMGLHWCNWKLSSLAAPTSAWFGQVCGWPTWAQPTQYGLIPVPCKAHTPGKHCWVVTEPNAPLLPMSFSPAGHRVGRQGKGNDPGVHLHFQQNLQLRHGQSHQSLEPGVLLLSNLALLKFPESNGCWQKVGFFHK